MIPVVLNFAFVHIRRPSIDLPLYMFPSHMDPGLPYSDQYHSVGQTNDTNTIAGSSQQHSLTSTIKQPCKLKSIFLSYRIGGMNEQNYNRSREQHFEETCFDDVITKKSYNTRLIMMSIVS